MNMLNVSHVFLTDLTTLAAELEEAAWRARRGGPRITSYNACLYPVVYAGVGQGVCKAAVE